MFDDVHVKEWNILPVAVLRKWLLQLRCEMCTRDTSGVIVIAGDSSSCGILPAVLWIVLVSPLIIKTCALERIFPRYGLVVVRVSGFCGTAVELEL